MKTAIWFGVVMTVGCAVSPTSQMPSKGGKTASDDASNTVQVGPIQQLSCSSSQYTLFKATLDGSSYVAGSNFFVVRDASIFDNYASANLICAGSQLDQIRCIGFWFDDQDQIGEVSVTNTASGPTASYAGLQGDLVGASAVPWPCTVQ
jgi:hypothetical protein